MNKIAKVSSTGSVKSLGGLSDLAGLVVKQTSAVSDFDVEDQHKAMLQAKSDAQKKNDVVRVSRETKGRGGKAVTLVTGISLPDKDLDNLAKRLKTACGSGGTVKDGVNGRVIEVQGDHIDRIVAMLSAQGYKAKRAGA